MPKRPRRGATILLADDHPLVRKGLRALLESEAGLAIVAEASDGREAVERARTLRPDVVVLDVSMPGMSGIEAAARILAESPDSKIVTLSMHSDKRFVDDMLKAGAAAYVLKDSAPEDLVVAIRAALRGECFLSPPILGTVVSGYREAVEGGSKAPFILQTKLHRPTLPPDLVPRTAILDRLDAGLDLPLTLVSAPAGYGKSLLIASWLPRCGCPGAWLALDAEDSDLAQFLLYVAAAVRRVVPDACPETLRIATGAALPPMATVAATLSNELDALEDRIVLVLDDYHQVESGSPVNELLQSMALRPPGRLHLVLISRRDPPLPLALLRARGQVNEIRMRELRFGAAEARALLDASLLAPISDEALAHVEHELEGWVAGLRLVALSLGKGQDASAVLQHLRGGVQHAQQYLTHEAVAGQPPGVREWLLKTAILRRFCARSCGAVCAEPDDPQAAEKGAAFIRTLCDENLFVVPLDAEGQWFRFHQLFQELLEAELKRVAAPSDIAALHLRASEWFEREGLADEAVRHALAAGDIGRAAEIADRHAEAVVNEGGVHVLARWLSQLPPDVIEGRVGLLRAEAWRRFFRMELGTLPAVLDRIERLLGSDPDPHRLSMEVLAFRGWCALMSNDSARALELSEKALTRGGLSNEPASRWLAEFVFGLAGQMEGQRERVGRSLTRWLVDRSARDPAGEIRLAQSLAFASYLAADPPGADALLERSRRIAMASGHASLVPVSDYLEGLFRVQRGDLESALALLGDARRHKHIGRSAVDGMCARALALQALGAAREAADAVRSLDVFIRDSHPWFAPIADACRVRLALMQGRADAGSAWLSTSEPPAAEAMLWWFEVPAVTWCRALVAEGSADRLRDAEERLCAHAAMNEAHHNACQLIGILCVLAVTRARLGKRDEAESSLRQAVMLAEPGGFVFPFLEAADPMTELLRQLKGEHDEFVGRLLRDCRPVPGAAAAPKDAEGGRPDPQRAAAGASGAIVDALTNRELDILELLAERFQNKEIAARLNIAPETVNYHLKHIYQKLNVQSRRQAVTAATELGLLDGRRGSPDDRH